jgi:superfamily II DNA or RNA helicase
MSSYINTQLTRDCQISTIRSIQSQLVEQQLPRCLIKHFCGSGKSRLIIGAIILLQKQINIIVVPSLALIQQLYDDYLSIHNLPMELSQYKFLNISSKTQEDLLGDDYTNIEDIYIDCTTDPDVITRFLNMTEYKKLICITYQSLPVLLTNLQQHMIGLACFDEAHRSVGDNTKKYIYEEEFQSKYEKQLFYTATPVNKNGITMFNRENNNNGIYGDCGPLHSDCEYTYLNGLRDGVLSLFNIRVDMYTESESKSLLYSIARSIYATGNTRVLTFHSEVSMESKTNTSVLQFVQYANTYFLESMNHICQTEFPHLKDKYDLDTINIIGLTASTPNKKVILQDFGKVPNNEIYILASCGTINEGVDTKNANHIVFVNPKTSIKDIIQNIGRGCRKEVGVEYPPATILIPVYIDTQKYKDCGNDTEKCDSVLREQLNLGENGDYNAILNVCAAVKEEDPELHDLLLKYPSNFTQEERLHALKKQHVYPDFGAIPKTMDEINREIESGVRVEIHTNDPNNPVIIYNDTNTNGVCYYQDNEENDNNDEDTDTLYDEDTNDEDTNDEDTNTDTNDEDNKTRYYPIISKDTSKHPYNVLPPNVHNRPKFEYHTNDEIKLYWKVSNDTKYVNKINSVIIECKIEKIDTVEIWKEINDELIVYMNTDKKRPSTYSKDNKIKRLGQWIQNQKKNYDEQGPEHSKYIMKNPEIHTLWTQTMTEYSDYLCDNIQRWKDKNQEAIEYMNTNKKTPDSNSKDIKTTRLGTWIMVQKRNYDSRGHEHSNHIMKTPEIYALWTKTMTDYLEYLSDAIQQWNNMNQQLIVYMNTNKKSPSSISKDTIIKRLGHWVSNQKKNYDKKGPEYSKQGMKNPEIHALWTKNLTEYSEYLSDAVQKWKNTNQECIEYMNTNKKRPSEHSKDTKIKRLGVWVRRQKTIYDERGPEHSNQIMKTSENHALWTKTMTDYSEYLCIDNVQQWKNINQEYIEYMNTNKKIPYAHSKDKQIKRLGQWVGTQKKNYDSRGPEYSKDGMKNPEIHALWTQTKQLLEEPIKEPNPKKIKEKENIKEPNTYDTMTEQERRAMIESRLREQEQKKGYRSTNPEDKDILNEIFASNIRVVDDNDNHDGYVIFLDHVEFKTADTLLKVGVLPENMIIPQRVEHFEEMKKHPLYGSCVVLEEFNDTLHRLMREGKKGSIKGIYADYCSTLQKDGLPFLEIVKSMYHSKLLTDNAVIGVTITLRNPEGVRFAGQDILFMEKSKVELEYKNKNYRNLTNADDGPYVYGNGAPMATWIFTV